jgi:hypothetical protein
VTERAARLRHGTRVRLRGSAAQLTRLVDLGAAAWPAGFLIGLILVALGAVAAYLVVRDVPIRKVSG